MGILVLISSPSGGGKNTVIKRLLAIYENARQLPTTTSRKKRTGERNGVDYNFISRKEFEEKLRAGNFVEHNEYANNYYGTERALLEKYINQFSLIFSQADVNGKIHLDEKNIPHVSIFLLPENISLLEKRIRRRGGLTENEIKRRIARAKEEINESTRYDYQITNKNGKIDETVEAITNILDPLAGS